MSSRAGWVLYLTILLAWIVAGAVRRRVGASADPAGVPARDRMLVLFVVGWAVILMAIAIAWWLFHRP